MKDEETFRQFLRRMGKKAHVVDELAAQVGRFETYLAEAGYRELETVIPADLDAYAAAVETRQPGASGKAVRGLALCYHFTGRSEMVARASQIHEQKTAKQRRIFPLKEFRGIDPAHIEKLAAAPIP
jgi:hypothetical protein